jgi:hypothetical protein
LRLLRPTIFARPLPGVAALPAVRWPHVYNKLNRTHTLLALLGVAVLVWWTTFWVGSLQKNHLKRSPVTWFGRYQFLGLDFLHNYRAARFWLDGGDPYHAYFGDPAGRKLCYPPIVLPFFAWCKLLPPRQALTVWTVALAVIAGAGVVAACRTRRELGLWQVPLPFALAAILVSAPMMYAMERGNFDLLILWLVLFAAWALQARTLARDLGAGSALALAACFKLYPALLVASLLPLRRGRAFACAGLATVGFASFQAQNHPVFIANLKELARLNSPEHWKVISPTNHSITGNWRLLWPGTKLKALAKVPPAVAAAALVGPLLLLVGYRVYRCPDPRRLVYPYLLWTASVATFIPSVANDYNLFFLPLAALAVWDRRDPVIIHLTLALMVIWAEPIRFIIDPAMLLVFKLVTLFAVSACLLRRINEQGAKSNLEPGTWKLELPS